MSEVCRISWSKHRGSCPKRKPIWMGGSKQCTCQPAITIYDTEGGFITRIDHPKDVEMFNAFVHTGLRTVNAEQKKRKEQNNANRGEETLRVQPEGEVSSESLRQEDRPEDDQPEEVG